MKFLYVSSIAIILIIALSAFLTIEITDPTSLTSQTSTSVNVSGGINASAYDDLTGGEMIGVMIMNKSCSSCVYSNHSNYIIRPSNSTNNIGWNRTITLSPGYNWIYLNFTNVTNIRGQKYAGSVGSDVSIVNIDPDRYILNVGGLNQINFTLDAGNITLAGNIKVAGCIQYNCSYACVTLGTCV